MKSRRAILLALLPVLAIGLAACSTSGPTVVSTPKIVYSEKGTSLLEADPAVKAARAADLGYRLAFNLHDFSIVQFTSTHTTEYGGSLFQGYHATYVVHSTALKPFTGPDPSAPLSVKSTANGAEVVFCEPVTNPLLTNEPDFDKTKGQEIVVHLTGSKTGNLVQSGEDENQTACDLTGAPIGRFSPVPKSGEKPSEANTKAPAGYKD